jgi:hypothetical protein
MFLKTSFLTFFSRKDSTYCYQVLTITEIRVGEKNYLKKFLFTFLFTEETWIRIRNQKKYRNRIRIKSMRISNPG